jgi:YidC/Oxa1 family membrane protein insertase
MEKRLLLFFAVTFLLVSLWPRLFPPPAPPLPTAGPDLIEPAAPGEQSVPEEEEPRSEPASMLVEGGKTAGGGNELPTRGARDEERVVVDTDVYRLTFSNRGAHLLSARLKEFEDEGGEPYELLSEEASEHTGAYPLDLRVANAAQTEELRKALYEVHPSGALAVSSNETVEVEFVWANGKGLEVTKRLRFEGASYGIDVEISVREKGQEVAKEILYGPGLGREIASGKYMGVEKGILASRGEIELFAAPDLDDGGTAVSVDAAGVASHYFAAIMLPEPGGLYGSRLTKTTIPAVAEGENGEARKERDVITAALEAPGSPAAFHLFLGPKKLELLEQLRPGLSRIIELGDWMWYPAILLRTGLVRLHERVGNWGWAIVLLTVVINLFLVPLKHYSFVSMRKMQKLAPQIQRIKDRYKKVKQADPRYTQMNTEIMSLYKEHKVNPVSGCLPMLLMIPFFFAFYRLLMSSIELRHAPFLLWIQDLSQFDPYFVLPILMGVTQIAIQRMTPQTTVDPVQAKIMQFMPIMFTFILAWAPAGLVLYWFSNNLVSMVQQVVTNRWLGKGEGEGGPQGEKAKKAAKQAQAHG